MSLTITWIRHGESEWNARRIWQGHSESPLSDRGKAQAAALGRRLSQGGYRFDRIYSSDLGRAFETAQLALPDSAIVVDSRLREIHFGALEGRSLDQLSPEENREFTRWWASPYQTVLSGGGESMASLRQRVDAWRAELTDKNIAVFTHGGVIRDALWRETSPPPDGSWSFQVDNTSLTIISYNEIRPGGVPALRARILRVNDHAHLEGLTIADNDGQTL